MEAIRVKRAVGGGSLPEGVIDAGRDRTGLAMTDIDALLMDPGPGHADLADGPTPDPLDGLGGRWRAAALGPELDDALVFPRGLDHAPSFDHVMAGGLLHVNILP